MPTAPPARLIRTAADLRAAGNAWEGIATEVGRTVAEVKTWPQRYAARWQQALAAAMRRTLDEATAEAVLVLRKQLRSKDDATAREAGMKLAQIRVLMEKTHRPAKGDEPSTTPPGYADRLLNHVRGMTDDQLAAEAGGGSSVEAIG